MPRPEKNSLLMVPSATFDGDPSSAPRIYKRYRLAKAGVRDSGIIGSPNAHRQSFTSINPLEPPEAVYDPGLDIRYVTQAEVPWPRKSALLSVPNAILLHGSRPSSEKLAIAAAMADYNVIVISDIGDGSGQDIGYTPYIPVDSVTVSDGDGATTDAFRIDPTQCYGGKVIVFTFVSASLTDLLVARLDYETAFTQEADQNMVEIGRVWMVVPSIPAGESDATAAALIDRIGGTAVPAPTTTEDYTSLVIATAIPFFS